MIHIQVFLRSLSGIMGCVKRQIHEKWIGTPGRALDKFQRIFFHHLAPMPASFPKSSKTCIGRRPGVVITRDRTIVPDGHGSSHIPSIAYHYGYFPASTLLDRKSVV